jgi:iron complex outermembrane receptor protein
MHEDLDVLNEFHFTPGTSNVQEYRQKTDYGSPYGFFSWAPADELSIEGGLRWNIEHKSYAIAAFLVREDQEDNPPVTRRTEITEYAPSGDISLNYRAFEDVNLYAKYSRGWKGPHFNGNVITTAGETGENLIEPVMPENVNALEIGLKSMWLDHRLRLDVAGFYYDYENIQIFQVRNTAGGAPVQELINANDADVYGLELEVEARPLEGWVPAHLEGLRLFGSFAWLESRYTDFLHTRVDSSGAADLARTENFSGNQLINAPQFAFAGYAQWDFRVGRYGTLTPRVDWSFKDEVFFSPANIEPVSQGALWLMNARLAYRTPDDTIEVVGWVRNLTDEIYRLDVIDLTRFQKSILYAMGDPRTYGISLSVSF